MKRTIRSFPHYGPENSSEVIEAVAERLQEKDLNAVIVGSSTGEMALRIAQRVHDFEPRIRVIAVCDPPWAIGKIPKAGRISPDNKAKLAELGGEVVDTVPYASRAYSTGASNNVYDALDLMVVVFDAFRMVGGNGLKVAIEVALMATNAGAVPPGQEVIAVAGTGNGLDTAVVMKTAYSIDIFSNDPSERPDVREILAMPREKRWSW
ncbi:MAG TPA: hypothetical protein VGA61_06330 [Anaerolineae bacterium]